MIAIETWASERGHSCRRRVLIGCLLFWGAQFSKSQISHAARAAECHLVNMQVTLLIRPLNCTAYSLWQTEPSQRLRLASHTVQSLNYPRIQQFLLTHGSANRKLHSDSNVWPFLRSLQIIWLTRLGFRKVTAGHCGRFGGSEIWKHNDCIVSAWKQIHIPATTIQFITCFSFCSILFSTKPWRKYLALRFIKLTKITLKTSELWNSSSYVSNKNEFSPPKETFIRVSGLRNDLTAPRIRAWI